jgi:hypothetical protein
VGLCRLGAEKRTVTHATLYASMLIIVSAGAGPYSLDDLMLGLMNKHVA